MGKRQDDITGQRFGSLTAQEPTAQRRNGYTVWRCLCDCGKEARVPSRHLKNGWRRDCGCGLGKGPGQDLTGRRFGMLQVLGPDEENRAENGERLWRCLCGCGARTSVPARQLEAGHKKSCGCARHPALKDWVGRRFGSLTVTAYDGKRGGKHYWRCLCGCGGETVVSQSNLQGGHTRSCGCLADPVSTRHFVDGTCIESIRSRRIAASNKSGVRGVYRNNKTGRWAAQITFRGKTRYLGSFESLEEAAGARAEAEKLFDDFLERYGEAAQAPRQEMSACPAAGGTHG